MDIKDLIKNTPVVDFDPNAKLTGKSITLEQLKEEYENAPNKWLYVESRFKEWLNLKQIFELDVKLLKEELRRAGAASDKFILEKLQEQIRIRDQWWSVALQKASGIKVDVGYPYNGTNSAVKLERLADDFVSVILSNYQNVRAYVQEKQEKGNA